MFGAKQFGVQQNSVQKDYQFQKVFGPILVSKCSGSKNFWVKITLCLELFEFRKRKILGPGQKEGLWSLQTSLEDHQTPIGGY